MNANILIVTRHTVLVQWLKQHGIEGPVIEQAAPLDVEGRDVYGILPLWLAAKTNSITEISMPGLPLSARKRVNGGDFTLEEMDAWGAHLKTFVVLEDDLAAFAQQAGKQALRQRLSGPQQPT